MLPAPPTVLASDLAVLEALLGHPVGGLLLLVLVGAVAGVVNTIAGGGAFLVLPALLALGLGPGEANGTMRVGIILQNVASVLTFHSQGQEPGRVVVKLTPALCVGALAGSWAATHLDDAMLRPIFGGALVVWAVVLVIKPGGFARASSEPQDPRLLTYGLALAIGVYGGFLQAGVGFPLMALFVSHLGYGPVASNSIKVAVVLIYTVLILPLFLVAGQVDWAAGLVLGLGTLFGGWLGTRWQVRRGAGLVRWVLVVAVAVSGVSMLARIL